MDDLIGFWFCSCCNQVFHSDMQLPANQYGNNLFECALCDVVNAELSVTEQGGANGNGKCRNQSRPS